MTDGRHSLELVLDDTIILKDICDESHPLHDIEAGSFFLGVILARDNTACFLAAVLQCVESIIRQQRRLRVSKHSKDTACAARFVVIEPCFFQYAFLM